MRYILLLLLLLSGQPSAQIPSRSTCASAAAESENATTVCPAETSIPEMVLRITPLGSTRTMCMAGGSNRSQVSRGKFGVKAVAIG